VISPFHTHTRTQKSHSCHPSCGWQNCCKIRINGFLLH